MEHSAHENILFSFRLSPRGILDAEFSTVQSHFVFESLNHVRYSSSRQSRNLISLLQYHPFIIEGNTFNRVSIANLYLLIAAGYIG